MLNIQKILFKKYAAKKSKNPSFSQRAFAKLIGISSGALSNIMNGKRKISKKMAMNLAMRLKLTDRELEEYLAGFQESKENSDTIKNIEYAKIQMNEYKAVSEWYHFAILSLVKCDDFKNSPPWIANRLGLNVSVVSEALTRLQKLGMLQEIDGQLTRGETKYSTSNEIKNYSLRAAHKESMKLAANSLDQVALEMRDISAITMAIDRTKLKEAKEEIRLFRDKIAAILETGEKKDVYKMNIQLFPLTLIE